MLLPVLLMVVVVPAALFAHSQGSLGGTASGGPSDTAHLTLLQPADRFMQSIVTDNGALGWRQLCPNIQAQLPMDQLVQQADAQRAAAAQEGVRLTMQFVGTHPQQDGGVTHVYVVTAHWPNGTTQQRMYNVLTQSSGCVEDVQNP
jgi:hypothetical protein